MRLLFVLPEYGPTALGGIATFYQHLFPWLVSAGCEIHACVVAPERPVTLSAVIPGLTVSFVDRAAVHREYEKLTHLAAAPSLRWGLASSFAAWEMCRRGAGYDAVEVTDWGMLYAPWLLAVGGPPIVVQFHGSSGQVNFHDPVEGDELAGVMIRLLETALLGRADELQSYGSGNAADWEALLGRPVRRILPGWLRREQPNATLRPEWDTESAGVVVGRVQSWKGPEVLCRAMKLLPAPPRVLWLGGDNPRGRVGDSMSAYLKAIYPEVWGRSILPVGPQPRSVVAAVQAAARYVIVPSTWDVFNLAAVEGMAAGKVVICSDGAGAAELIRHGENGFVFPAGDPKSLAAAITDANSLDETRRERIGAAASETVRTVLNPENVCAARRERYSHLRTTRPARVPHPWCESVFAASSSGAPLGFLNNIPLKQLARYAIRRGWERFWKGRR